MCVSKITTDRQHDPLYPGSFKSRALTEINSAYNLKDSELLTILNNQKRRKNCPRFSPNLMLRGKHEYPQMSACLRFSPNRAKDSMEVKDNKLHSKRYTHTYDSNISLPFYKHIRHFCLWTRVRHRFRTGQDWKPKQTKDTNTIVTKKNFQGSK